MLTTHIRPRRNVTVASFGLLVSLLIGTAACGSSDDTPDRAEPTDTTAAEVSTTADARTTLTTEPSTPSLAPPASTGDLEGTWTADAGDIIGANTANLGGTGALACAGPINMTFSGGRFDRTGSVTCGGGLDSPIEGQATIASTGAYSIDGERLVISATANTGTMNLAGTSIPFPDSWGDGAADFRITGDVLEITFSIAPVGTVTQKYVRAG